MNPVFIIHHGGCWDGFGAAMVATEAIDQVRGGNAIITRVPAFYGMDPRSIEGLEGADVYVVDFSFGLDDMLWLCSVANQVTWLDHHKSALEALAPLRGNSPNNFQFSVDLERSGIRLAWDWFDGGPPRPWLVDYIEDRDLWNKALPGTDAVQMWIRSHDMTADAWERMSSTELHDAASGGASMLRYHERMVDNAARAAVLAMIDGHVMPLVTVSYDLGSDVCDLLMRKHDTKVAGYFLLNKVGRWQYGFRSRDGFDCSELAAQFGGGGHAQAAGCQSAEPIHVVVGELWS